MKDLGSANIIEKNVSFRNRQFCARTDVVDSIVGLKLLPLLRPKLLWNKLEYRSEVTRALSDHLIFNLSLSLTSGIQRAWRIVESGFMD